MAWPKGQSGNLKGRPANPYVKQLRDALARYEKDHGYSFIDRCIDQAHKDATLSSAIMKKVLPDLKQVENDVVVTGNINLNHMEEDDLRRRITELESLGTRRAISPQEGRTNKKSKK